MIIIDIMYLISLIGVIAILLIGKDAKRKGKFTTDGKFDTDSYITCIIIPAITTLIFSTLLTLVVNKAIDTNITKTQDYLEEISNEVFFNINN